MKQQERMDSLISDGQRMEVETERERERDGGREGGTEERDGACVRLAIKGAVKPKRLTAQQWTAVRTESTSARGSPTLSAAFSNWNIHSTPSQPR